MAARIIEQLIEIPAEHERNIFGQFDEHIKKIERTLQVTLISRDGILKIVGPAPNVQKAEKIIRELLGLSVRGNTIQSQNVDYALSLTMEEKEAPLVEMDKDCICHTINGRPVKPKTLGQKAYVDKIREDMIVFGVGPAGTGKTYLAMAMAITAFRNDEVGRIILTRPAIEAGEKLGFLPGDLQSKVDPYLRPLYDALYQIMGPESFAKNMEKGFGSKVIITGDSSQKDLPSGQKSGLEMALQVLKKVEGISICQLTSKDVVRHPLVQKIVQAYEAYEKKHPEKPASPKNQRRRGNSYEY